jgi:hypothetical protein
MADIIQILFWKKVNLGQGDSWGQYQISLQIILHSPAKKYLITCIIYELLSHG